MLTRESILQKGFAEIPVVISGIRRKHKFVVRVRHSMEGPYPILETSPRVPDRELANIANKFMLPVSNGKSTIFPEGTTAKDFVNLI